MASSQPPTLHPRARSTSQQHQIPSATGGHVGGTEQHGSTVAEGEHQQGVDANDSGEVVESRYSAALSETASKEANHSNSSSAEEEDEPGGDETSTASGTITEGGEWESGHGFDVEIVERPNLRRVGVAGAGAEEEDEDEDEEGEEDEVAIATKASEGDGSGSPGIVPKRSSLQRVLDSAR